jgi:hypothetical protein
MAAITPDGALTHGVASTSIMPDVERVTLACTVPFTWFTSNLSLTIPAPFDANGR